MKHWNEKLVELIEKELDVFDTRPKKDRKFHPSGECYMNDILKLVEKLIKNGHRNTR